MKILIIEDNQDIAFLIKILIHKVASDIDVAHVDNSNDAIDQIPLADLVVSDFNFPTHGFLGILPTLQKENRLYVLQSSDLANMRTYSALQIGEIYKDEHFTSNFINLFSTLFQEGAFDGRNSGRASRQTAN